MGVDAAGYPRALPRFSPRLHEVRLMRKTPNQFPVQRRSCAYAEPWLDSNLFVTLPYLFITTVPSAVALENLPDAGVHLLRPVPGQGAVPQPLEQGEVPVGRQLRHAPAMPLRGLQVLGKRDHVERYLAVRQASSDVVVEAGLPLGGEQRALAFAVAALDEGLHLCPESVVAQDP